jgi:two-component system, response regulator / RNA-binding antiterminator
LHFIKTIRLDPNVHFPLILQLRDGRWHGGHRGGPPTQETTQLPGRLKIAVVEKDRDRAMMIIDGLRDAGDYVVTVIGDDTGLARKLAALGPDVVLIDLRNPNRDVLEALTLASNPNERPVAMFVDRSDDNVMRAAIEAGVSAYVVDGMARERIRPVLTAAIARFHMVARLRAELDATKAALEERKTVDRAKGLLMKAKGLDEEDAYALLRRTAMDQGKKLSEIAAALITASELLK